MTLSGTMTVQQVAEQIDQVRQAVAGAGAEPPAVES